MLNSTTIIIGGIIFIISIIYIIRKSKDNSQRFFNIVWSLMEKNFDKKLYTYKEKLFKQSTGVVLDVGSGTGPTFKYLKNVNTSNQQQRITKVVSIEPNHFMFKELKKTSKVLGDIPCEIYPKTIEEAIRDKDIQYGSFDTIICNLVLCSIPNPQTVLLDIQKLLKPGGRLIFLEHVISTNPIYQKLQYVFTPLWSVFFDDCCLTRKTDSYIKTMNGWSNVTIDDAKGPMLKYICGYAIKDNQRIN